MPGSVDIENRDRAFGRIEEHLENQDTCLKEIKGALTGDEGLIMKVALHGQTLARHERDIRKAQGALWFLIGTVITALSFAWANHLIK